MRSSIKPDSEECELVDAMQGSLIMVWQEMCFEIIGPINQGSPEKKYLNLDSYQSEWIL